MKFLALVIFFVQAKALIGTRPNYHEKRLIKHLFDTYDPRIRPVVNQSDAVQVYIGLALRQLTDVDERNQFITTNLWVRQYWSDPFLVWEPKEYGNIKSFNVLPSNVWLPDIVLYNNVDNSKGPNLDKFETRVNVNYDGKISWFSPAIFKSTCDIFVKYFPFDQQNCHLTLASWTYNGWQLNLTNKSPSGDIGSYIPNSEWHLPDMPVKRVESFFSCCPEPYPTITFTLRLRRLYLYYLFNLIIPCLIITVLALLSFYLPPESGERIGLVITTLLAMTVFMLLVAETMPMSEDVPLVAKFYLAAMGEIGLSLLATCTVIKYYYTDPSFRKMPYFLRLVVLEIVGPAVGINVGNYFRNFRDKKYEDIISKESEDNLYDAHKPYPSQSSLGNGHVHEKNEKCFLTNPWRSIPDATSYKNDTKLMRRLINEIKVISGKIKSDSVMDELQCEWKMAARILDRFFFIVFVVTLIASTILTFLQAPTYD